MNDAAGGMAEHGVVDTILVTEERLVVFSFFDIVYLHGVVTLRCEQLGTFIVEVERDYGRWLTWNFLSAKVLCGVSPCFEDISIYHI